MVERETVSKDGGIRCLESGVRKPRSVVVRFDRLTLAIMVSVSI